MGGNYDVTVIFPLYGILNYLYKVYFLNIQIFCKSKFAERIKSYSTGIIKNFLCCAVYSLFNIKITFAKRAHDMYKIVWSRYD